MPIKRTIPGQLREQECQAIELLASLVSENGVIVEVGSLLGLSSWIWAQSAHSSVKVYCIDPWEIAGGSNFQKLANENNQSFTLNQFKQNVKDCPNIVPCQGYSPQDFSNWDKEVSLYFEDAVHTDPIFSANMAFWASHLAPEGIMCGHDYHPRFPDIQQGVHAYAKKLDRKLRVIGALWYLLPHCLEISKDSVVRETLEKLELLSNFVKSLPAPCSGEDAAAYSRRVVSQLPAFDYKATITNSPCSVRQGQIISLNGVIENISGADWPIVLLDKAVLKLTAFLEQEAEVKVAAVQHHIHLPVWKAGERVTFSLELNTLRAKVGPATVRIDLCYEYICWFKDKGAEPLHLKLDITPPAYFDNVRSETPIEDPQFWMQNVPEYCQKTQIGIHVTQQQHYTITTPDGPVTIKSMLTSYELSLLYSVARFYCSGIGKIVDLGPLLGVGTNVMARGAIQNPAITDKKNYIYSYDLFLMENMGHFLPVSDSANTGSVFWRFQQLNKEFTDVIHAIPGDILNMRWNGEPIELLFIDLKKTWKLNSYVVENFFPHLIPGHSIVIQQDYVHVGEPWIALQMEIFSEYFELLYYIYGATAVYRLKKAIPAELIKIDLSSLDLSEIDSYFEQARSRAPASVAEVLKCCQAVIHIERGNLITASALLKSVDLNVEDRAELAQNFIPAIPANLNAATRWLERATAQEATKQKALLVEIAAPTLLPGASIDKHFPVEATDMNTQKYIHSVYTGILGRNAEPQGLESWLKRLETEPAHRLPRSLVQSAEFQRNYIHQLVQKDGRDTVARFSNLLSLASLGKPLHMARCELVTKHLPIGAQVLDLGGAGGDEGALMRMGYRGAKKITVIDLPENIRFKPALEKVSSCEFQGTEIEYQYHSMADLSRYEDNFFDFVWSGQTIEHVTLEEGDAIFRQVMRILKPGGAFALDTPNRTLTRLAVGETGFIHGEHKHEYGFEELIDRHRKIGMELTSTKGLIAMPRSLSLGYLVPDEVESGNINDTPENSIVFFVIYRKKITSS